MGFPPASNEKILGVTMGFRFGSLSATLTYDSVGISSLFPINYPMSGKLYISVIGSGISLNDNSFEGKLGHTGIQQTVWFSDTSILCKFLLAFATGSRSVFLTSGSIGTMTFAGTYDSPSISQEAPFNVAQPNTITLSGVIFSPRQLTLTARLDKTSCSASTWISSSSVFCRSPFGAASSAKTMVTIQLSVSSASKLLTFDLHYISSIALNTPKTGAVSVTISGVSIYFQVGVSLAARFGFSAAQITRWVSATCIIAKNSAGISRSSISLLTAGLGRGGSVSRTFSHDIPMFGIQRESPGISTVLVLSAGQNYVNGTYTTNTGKLYDHSYFKNYS